jgi:RNA polymerase sigma-70 factor (ECF subfamily)
MIPTGASGAARPRLDGTGMEQAASMARAVDEGAFEAMLAAHRGIVFKVANTYCRLPEDRADLAQEIAAQLWRAWPGYDPARPASTWMYRIALNVAMSFVRNASLRHRHAVPLDESVHELAAAAQDHDTDLEHAQRLRLLQAFIARQAPIDRALLLLYLDERGQREIGEILGISESNVSTKIGRLKQTQSPWNSTNSNPPGRAWTPAWRGTMH